MCRFGKSALSIEPNPEGGHYDLSDTSMFFGNDLEFNGFWTYVPGPLLTNAGYSYLPDSASTLIDAVVRDPQGYAYSRHCPRQFHHTRRRRATIKFTDWPRTPWCLRHRRSPIVLAVELFQKEYARALPHIEAFPPIARF